MYFEFWAKKIKQQKENKRMENQENMEKQEKRFVTIPASKDDLTVDLNNVESFKIRLKDSQDINGTRILRLDLKGGVIKETPLHLCLDRIVMYEKYLVYLLNGGLVENFVCIKWTSPCSFDKEDSKLMKTIIENEYGKEKHSIKLVYNDDTRRIQLRKISISCVYQFVREEFKIKRFYFTYVDDEDDILQLKTDIELKEALSISKEKVLKIFVTNLDEKKKSYKNPAINLLSTSDEEDGEEEKEGEEQDSENSEGEDDQDDENSAEEDEQDDESSEENNEDEENEKENTTETKDCMDELEENIKFLTKNENKQTKWDFEETTWISDVVKLKTLEKMGFTNKDLNKILVEKFATLEQVVDILTNCRK